MPPPPLPGKGPNPPPPNSSGNNNPMAGLSLAEQLVIQSQNLKKVQTENTINNKIKNLNQSQQMQITKNLHAVLE
jgi:hypothetical protein